MSLTLVDNESEWINFILLFPKMQREDLRKKGRDL